jgi:DNA processing protein
MSAAHSSGDDAARRPAWVALAATPGITPRGCALLLARFGGPDAVLRASAEALAAVPGVSAPAARRLASGESSRRAVELLARPGSGVCLLTPDDEDYPRRLRELPDPPPALWCRGEPGSVDAAIVAVVGSRRPSAYGEAMARRISSELARAGVTVASGLARGIDAAAHRAALEAGGQTIAVLGCGLDHIYPKEHRTLQEAIGRQGAVLSEFAPDAPPLSHHFPQRNRLISGVSLGVVVVEAGERSGSLITARLALEQGREVFAVPGNVGAGGSVGTNRLIKAGAVLAEGVADILQAVAPQLESASLRQPLPRRLTSPADPNAAAGPAAPARRRTESDQLTAEEAALIELLTHEPRHMDELAVRSGRPVQQVAALLVSLEIKGSVRQLPGNYYCQIA